MLLNFNRCRLNRVFLVANLISDDRFDLTKLAVARPIC